MVCWTVAASMISLRILQNSKVRKILDLLAVYAKLLLCLCAVFLIQCYFLWLVPWFCLLVQGIFCFKQNLEVNFLLGLFMKKEGHGLQHLHCHCKGLYKLFHVDQDVSVINLTLATCFSQKCFPFYSFNTICTLFRHLCKIQITFWGWIAKFP